MADNVNLKVFSKQFQITSDEIEKNYLDIYDKIGGEESVGCKVKHIKE